MSRYELKEKNIFQILEAHAAKLRSKGAKIWLSKGIYTVNIDDLQFRCGLGMYGGNIRKAEAREILITKICA